ncbi:MAG: XRE family transcriptional regulator [Bacteroidia bacterium]|nr:XRE family transcriptional regulator [Bacteroidia bacterium]
MIPNLKNARVKKGLKQKELAKMLNVSSKTVSNYELGFRDPDIKMLIKISQILNVTIDYLVGLEQKTLIEQIKERIQSLQKEELANLLSDYIEFIAKIK